MPRFLRALPILLSATVALSAPSANVKTLSGDGVAGFAQGQIARWNYPFAATSDILGNVYVADTENHAIRVVAPDGTVRVLAGRVGSRGSEDGPATVARFNTPRGIVAGSNGEIFVADSGNHVIRRIDASGKVTTFAGVAGKSGTNDGWPQEARFSTPSGLTIDARGVLYVADTANQTIRTVDPDGRVRTLAGTGLMAGTDDGFGTLARFSFPWGITLLPSGELLVTDSGSHVVRSVSANGAVRTLYGTPLVRGYADGDGSLVRFATPTGIASDAAGNVFIADADNNVVRSIVKGHVATLAGTANDCFRDGAAAEACFNHPVGVAVVGSRLVVLDTYNQAVRTIETVSTPTRRRSVRR